MNSNQSHSTGSSSDQSLQKISNYAPGEVRVRFAPSPTGYLHVGGGRTALYNFLFARRHKGTFILRIEDTDLERSTEESLQGVLKDLKWLGLDWDEGPGREDATKEVGSYGPYKQSNRLPIYKKVADELLSRGQAYYCFLTDAEIDQQREKAKADGRPYHIQSPYENWTLEKAKEELARGQKAVVRFKTKELKKDYIFQDLIRSEVKFPSDMVGDFVLLRSDGMPVYNFCCVVDDYQMKISHVFRAEEHLPNTLRQLMIYEAMNWKIPKFGHLSVVLDEDRQKLSKRRGAVSCSQFKDEGYLPEALLNFIALLGWSHPEGKEIFTVEDMISVFDPERLHGAGAVFDRVKLKWTNATHLRSKTSKELWTLIEPFLAREKMEFTADPFWRDQSVETFKTSMETLADAIELYRPLNDLSFEVFEEAREALSWPTTRQVLEAWKIGVSEIPRDYLTESEFLKIQEDVKNKTGAKGKNLFMPIRVAVIGKPHGTELKILVPLMKKTSLIKRVELVLSRL